MSDFERTSDSATGQDQPRSRSTHSDTTYYLPRDAEHSAQQTRHFDDAHSRGGNARPDGLRGWRCGGLLKASPAHALKGLRTKSVAPLPIGNIGRGTGLACADPSMCWSGSGGPRTSRGSSAPVGPLLSDASWRFLASDPRSLALSGFEPQPPPPRAGCSRAAVGVSAPQCNHKRQAAVDAN